MPLKSEWLDSQKSIICCTGTNTWSWGEYHKALDEIVILAKTTDHRVDLIIARGENSRPPKGSQMPHFQRATRIMPSNVSLITVTGANLLARTIVNIFTKLNPSTGPKVILVESVDDAVTYIKQDRQQRVRAA
ncbi:MAG: hypothetical protein R3E39_20650 [Anaerolineae bacterium]